MKEMYQIVNYAKVLNLTLPRNLFDNRPFPRNSRTEAFSIYAASGESGYLTFIWVALIALLALLDNPRLSAQSGAPVLPR